MQSNIFLSNIFLKIFNHVLYLEILPGSWAEGYINLLFKNGVNMILQTTELATQNQKHCADSSSNEKVTVLHTVVTVMTLL